MRHTLDMNSLIAVIGWIGALAVLLPYVLLSLGRMKAESVSYQALNALGSALLVLNTIYNRSFPSATVNFIWVCIAIYAFIKQARRRRT